MDLIIPLSKKFSACSVFMRLTWLAYVCVAVVNGAVASEATDYRIQLDVIRRGYDGDYCWVHPRAGIVVGQTNPTSVVLTMTQLWLKGSDVFFALNEMRTDDLG